MSDGLSFSVVEYWCKQKMRPEENQWKKYLISLFDTGVNFKLFIRNDFLDKRAFYCGFHFQIPVPGFIFIPRTYKSYKLRKQDNQKSLYKTMIHEYSHHIAIQKCSDHTHRDSQTCIEIYLNYLAQKKDPGLKLRSDNILETMTIFSPYVLKKVQKAFGPEHHDVFEEIIEKSAQKRKNA